MFSWDLIRSFLALHRAGTFEGAAQMLGVDHSTVRRRIHALEQQVGRPLFTGNGGAYLPLPESEPLLEAATAMELSSRRFSEGNQPDTAGELRVTMLDVFATLLAPFFTEFRARHPAIGLDITTEHHFVDLEREQVDVAIRLARPMRGKSRMRKLADIRFGVYAAPAYLARRPAELEGGDDLLILAVRFLHRDHDMMAGNAAWSLMHMPEGRIAATTDSYLALRSLCEAGMGLALLPELLGEASGELQRVDTAPRATCELWLVLHADTGSTRRAAAFTDFLASTFRQHLSAGS